MPDKTVALDRKVPAFALPASGGGKWKLADAAGKHARDLLLSQGRHLRLHQ